MMALSHELLRLAQLRPLKPLDEKTGKCSCLSGELTILYKKGVGRDAVWQCDMCIALCQSYPIPSSKSGAGRLIEGNSLLITRDAIDFWGTARLDQVNPKIRVHSATGQMAIVLANIIQNPPATPWMFVEFAKSQVEVADLVVTEDNSILRFGGASKLRQLNREQVLQMLSVGMKETEWRTYMMAYADHNQTVIDTMHDKYPALHPDRGLRIPPVNSPEHNALKKILKGG